MLWLCRANGLQKTLGEGSEKIMFKLQIFGFCPQIQMIGGYLVVIFPSQLVSMSSEVHRFRNVNETFYSGDSNWATVELNVQRLLLRRHQDTFYFCDRRLGHFKSIGVKTKFRSVSTSLLPVAHISGHMWIVLLAHTHAQFHFIHFLKKRVQFLFQGWFHSALLAV